MLGTWKAGLGALRKEGARLVDKDGTEHRFEVQATDDPRKYQRVKHVLVLVKAWQTERVAGQLKECLADDGLVLTLQNGLGNREALAQSLGLSRVALGTTTTGATLLSPGLVRAGGEGMISIERHQALGPIEEALKSAKFNVNVVEDAQSLIWGKLVINAAINPLTALLRVPNGKLLESPSAREMMGRLAIETAQVAKREKIQLPFSDPSPPPKKLLGKQPRIIHPCYRMSCEARRQKSMRFAGRSSKSHKNTILIHLQIGPAGS